MAAAYLHDIGMVDMTPVGRRTHAQFAAHAAFGPDVTPLVDHLLAPGPVRDRLDEVAARAPFATSLEVVVREMLSLSVAHSKSAVPAAVLNDRVAFRRLAAARGLHRPRRPSGAPTGSRPRPTPIRSRSTRTPTRYADPTQSFAWLSAMDGPQAELADDVIDALRALRAADVLRQRGTVLRTSGGFELCMDARDGAAPCARCGPRAATRPT